MDVGETNSPYYEMEPLRRCDDPGSDDNDSAVDGPVILIFDNFDREGQSSGDVGTKRSSSTTSDFSEFIAYRCGFWTKIIQERTLVIGQWVWCLLCLITFDDVQEWEKIYLTHINIGNGFMLLLLWFHKQARDDLEDHQKQMMATTLIPTLFSSAFIFSMSVENEIMSYPLKGLFVIVIGTKFCSRRLSELVKLHCHSTATRKQAQALVVGQWIWPALLGGYFYNSKSYSWYYVLLIAGNGFLLVLLWCNKQARDEIEYPQKELSVSELIPTLIFFCLPMDFRYDTMRDEGSFTTLVFYALFLWLIVTAIVVASTFGPRFLSLIGNATKKVFGSCFRGMEESYFDYLRAFEEQDERVLLAQQDSLAHLETAGTSSSSYQRNKMMRGAVIILIALAVLTFVIPFILAEIYYTFLRDNEDEIKIVKVST